MARKRQRIVEAYCWRGPVTRKNPLGGRKKMRVAVSLQCRRVLAKK